VNTYWYQVDDNLDDVTTPFITVVAAASDVGGGVVAAIEVSLDNGTRWHPMRRRGRVDAASNDEWVYTWGDSPADVIYDNLSSYVRVFVCACVCACVCVYVCTSHTSSSSFDCPTAIEIISFAAEAVHVRVCVRSFHRLKQCTCVCAFVRFTGPCSA
jgi:hypothetical protein